MQVSKYNHIITMEYLTKTEENLYYDRKKGKISKQDLANNICSFANANGGIIALGITDNGIVEGLNMYGINKVNDFQKVITDFLSPTPNYKMELLNVINDKKEKDVIILFHIEPAMNYIVKNNKDEVYLRQGDSSIKLNMEQIRSLEYERNERNFETEVIEESSVEDIDKEVIKIYKDRIGASKISDEQILKARGFLVESNNKLKFTKSGMLLFGKNPSIYIPNSRVRVLKFEGRNFQVGQDMNIIKDRTFDKCLYKILKEAKDFINSQLREFTHLNKQGTFETIPEYPEFAWYEGLVNAVTHRDYSNTGEYINVRIYDDRLEIDSPGKLGGFVTVKNMRTERYSRNPRIARVLNEFGIVRELNEGVKRIYKEMERFYLKEPIYLEPGLHSVLLILDNNVVMRSKRKTETMLKNTTIKKIWNELNYQEQRVVQAIYDKGEMSSEEVSLIIERGKTTAVKLLNRLIDKDLIVWTGTNKYDNNGNYILKIK